VDRGPNTSRTMVFSTLIVAGNAQEMLPNQLHVDFEDVAPLATEQPLAGSALMLTRGERFRGISKKN
jgi:hypothetical protein